MIADTLRAAGLQVDVQRARRVRALEPCRAVVLGSAVYRGRWRRDAVRLLRRPQLKAREVWLFSSGPVADKATRSSSRSGPNPRACGRSRRASGCASTIVFGGMVAEDAGFIRKKMARNIPPELRDRREWHQIEAWAQSIATALTGQPTPPGKEPGGLA